MDLALYCPDCGYYETENDRIGRRGDFHTSVSVGPLFGELLAFQFAAWLAQLGAGRLQLVESGAHDGRLAADILRWLQQWRPDIFARTEYLIGEISTRRQGWQRKTLQEFAAKVRWLDPDMAPQAGRFNGIIFANEFLDALPVHRVGWDARQREWYEWGVVVKEEQFCWSRMKKSQILSPESPVSERLRTLPAELLDILPDDFTTELPPVAERWWHHAGMALQHGWLLTIDYGLLTDDFFAPHRSWGTLRAYRRHRLCKNLLANAGGQDLTAHVNFSAIQQVGETAGLRTELFTTQADFLVQVMKRFWSETEARGAWTNLRNRAFQTLVHPAHLGRAFRVLVQSR